MKVAAYQAPLLTAGSMDALELMRARVNECEAKGVVVLCCPEAILGGLADDDEDPARFAIAGVESLNSTLAPLASDTVTSIVGFTELGGDGRLYNAAAVFSRGSVIGVYRKLHPAINRSVYEPGRDLAVFRVGGLTFGIVICNDSNFSEPAKRMAAQGATVLFVPTNNGLPPRRAHAKLIDDARKADIARATENRRWIVRADVAGRSNERVSYGSSGIVSPEGKVIQSAQHLTEELIVAEIETRPAF